MSVGITMLSRKPWKARSAHEVSGREVERLSCDP
jgi:hypothetical protein